MNTTQKEQIAANLAEYVAQKSSQNQAAKSLLNVSLATVSQVLAGNWKNISDKMWRTIAAQVAPEENWTIVKTSDFQRLTGLLADAQKHHNVFAVIGSAGCGKSVCMREYASRHRNAHLLQCNEFWNRKYFLIELLRAMSRDGSGLSVNELMYEVVRQLKMQENPLIILDEGDKLTDQVLYFFISLYNALEDHCGIVLAATDHLEKRLKKGLRLNKKGYNEIYSRIGRKCIELGGVGIADITQVCMANGIDDKATIKSIIKDSENDLRRVKRRIHALRQKASTSSATETSTSSVTDSETNRQEALETLENVQ